MRRRTFDTLMSLGGLALTIILLVAGTLLWVGYDFANSNVEEQLVQQKITMPAGPAIEDPRIRPYLTKFAGQQMTNGEQAEAYANHFIAVHVADIGKGTYYEGKTYSEMGALERANPTDTAIRDARNTVFKGETLRGLLLNAYAFWKVGQIAKLASVIAFGFAAIMALLTVLGFWHLRRVSPEEEVLGPPVELRRAAG